MEFSWDQTVHYIKLIMPIVVLMFLFFLIGLWIAWWIWGKGARTSIRSLTQLCSTVEEQQDLLVEQQVKIKRLVDRVRIAEETMRVSLGPGVVMLQRELAEREKEIERLSKIVGEISKP